MRKSGASHPPKLEHSGLDQRAQGERREGRRRWGGETRTGQGGSVGQASPALSLRPARLRHTCQPSPGPRSYLEGRRKRGQSLPIPRIRAFQQLCGTHSGTPHAHHDPQGPYGSFSNLISSPLLPVAVAPSTQLCDGLGTQGLRVCPCSFMYSRSLCSGPCLSVTFSERPP